MLMMIYVGPSAHDKWFPREKFALASGGLGEGYKWSRHLD